MSIETTYPFTNPSNYTFDPLKIEVTGGVAKLKKIEDTHQFIQDFSSGAGFTYDPTKVEFAGGKIRQKDQRPANAIIASDFDTSFNANWGAVGFVDTNGNLNGSPVLTGGKLSCPNGSNGLYYQDALIGNTAGNFVAKFKYTPNYNGGPLSNVNIFTLQPPTGVIDRVVIFNSPTANSIRITAAGLSAATFGTWTAVSGNEYVFEVICINNVVSLYIDGVKLGADQTITTPRGTTATRLYLGAAPTVYDLADGSFNDLVLYTTEPQNENYTFPAYIYDVSEFLLPVFVHTGPGFITTLDDFTTIETGTNLYIIKAGAGNYKYWNGSAWVISNETSLQANDAATINSNIPTFTDSYGETQIYIKGFFVNNSNDRSDIDELSINHSDIEDYYQDNPTIEGNSSFYHEGLEGFAETATKIGLDEIKYILKKNNDFYYYNGVDWVLSNGTYAQSNTAAEVLANVALFTLTPVLTTFKAFLHSNDGLTTPELDLLSILYNFSGTEESIEKTIVWCDNNKNSGPDITPLSVELMQDVVKYKNATIIRKELLTVTPTATGVWEIELIETDNMDPTTYYKFQFNGFFYKATVPNNVTVNFWDLPNLQRVGS